MNKKAFTLAEILITMAILGVVAALTIRSIIVNSEKLITETKLKTIYSELQQALDAGAMQFGKMTQADFSQNTKVDIFDIYFAPYLKVDQICTSSKGRDCGYQEGKFWKRRDKNYEQSFPQASSGGTNMHRKMVKLQNGVVLLFNPWACDDSGCWDASEIFIDIDGPKGRNLYGRDVFIFTINFDTNKMMTKKYNATLSSVKDNCKGSGHWCAAWIQKSGWKIPNGYPW